MLLELKRDERDDRYTLTATLFVKREVGDRLVKQIVGGMITLKYLISKTKGYECVDKISNFVKSGDHM